MKFYDIQIIYKYFPFKNLVPHYIWSKPDNSESSRLATTCFKCKREINICFINQ